MDVSFRPQVAVAAALIAGAVALAGCSTVSQGMGGGQLQLNGGPTEPVLFSWQSSDGGISGSMVATLPDTTYSGTFVQVTHETEHTTLAPLWAGWGEGWGDWPDADPGGFGAATTERFSRVYSGKVVANLQDARGQRMRCRFNMANPVEGMAGGGEGECQLKGGKVTAAVIDRR